MPKRVEPYEVIKKLDEKFGRDNWWIRKVSTNSRGEPSLTLSSLYLKKIGVQKGDKVLVYVEDGRIVIQKV